MAGPHRLEAGRPVGSLDGCIVYMAKLGCVRDRRRYRAPFLAGGR